MKMAMKAVMNNNGEIENGGRRKQKA